MAANRLEQTKPADEAAKPAGSAVAARAAKKGNPWIPLVANIVIMPAIAYTLTTFVLIPKIQAGKGENAAHATSEHGEKKQSKVTVPLGGKVLVNVAGTAGTRYLVATITLVGKKADLKEKVEASDP